MTSSAPTRPPVVGLRNGAVAAIVAAVIVGVVLLGTFEFSGSAPPSNSCSICGAGMAIGSPLAGGGPGNYSYRMEFAPSSGFHWGQGQFEITSSLGENLSPLPSWAVLILNVTSGDAPIAAYSFETGAWTAGANILATSAQSIELELGASDLRGQGDIFELILLWNGHSQGGSISESLP